MRKRGVAMAMQCRYMAGPRIAVVGVSVYSDAATASSGLAAVKGQQAATARRDKTLIYAKLGTLSPRHFDAALAKKLLAAALAHL